MLMHVVHRKMKSKNKCMYIYIYIYNSFTQVPGQQPKIGRPYFCIYPPPKDTSHHKDYCIFYTFFAGNSNLNNHLPMESWDQALHLWYLQPQAFRTPSAMHSCKVGTTFVAQRETTFDPNLRQLTLGLI